MQMKHLTSTHKKLGLDLFQLIVSKIKQKFDVMVSDCIMLNES